MGIGGSAGALEAMQELLGALGHETGLAYVVVQHLAPTHDSLLGEILGRSTRMPVRQAQQGMPVAANHVYVIPPDQEIAVEQGRLRLGNRATGRERFLPIDHFFRSLAEDCRDSAVGVLLSGTASDGVEGLRAIKAAGGTTFAQDEASAKYPEMPRSAAASGAVDLVMPPEAIARELGRLGRHAFVPHDGPPAEIVRGEDVKEVESILRTLRESTGADFTDYKQTTIRRRILRRMALARVERLADYAKLLRENRAEVDGLQRDVLINVTSFFRDPATFKVLQRRVLPGLLRGRKAGQRVRLWVPGCSTGEEVYSLAITAFEAAGERPDADLIQIFGTDLSESVVDQARLGRYPANIAADVEPDLLARYFTRTADGFQISKTLRDVCVFAKHNLLRDPPFSKIDVLSCRNVLIYFGSLLQRKAISLFHYALNPRGVLLLGSAEHVAAFGELFGVLDKKHRIYVKNPGPNRLVFEASAADGRRLAAPEPAPAKPEAGGLEVQREADRIVLLRMGPPGVVVDGRFDVLQFRGQTGPYLEARAGVATLNLLKLAREGLVSELKSLLQRVVKEGRPVQRSGLRVRGEGGEMTGVRVEVVPFSERHSRQRLYLVLFHADEGRAKVGARRGGGGAAAKDPRGKKRQPKAEELAATREYLQTIVEEQEATNEELMSANEEILSSNEELQSTNEELETAKEELQSSNEELRTVNDELQDRNGELHTLNADLNHLLTTLHIPMVILDRELRLRRASPLGERMLNLIAGDVGRKVTDVRPNVDIPDFAGVVRGVLDTVTPREVEVRDHEGRWWCMQVRPRKNGEQKIDGVVITWIDMEATQKQARKAARGLAWTLLESVTGPAAVLSPDLRVERGNAPWRARFGSGPRDGPLTWGDEACLRVLKDVFTNGRPVGGQRAKAPTTGRDFQEVSYSALLLPADEVGPLSVLLCVEPIRSVGSDVKP